MTGADKSAWRWSDDNERSHAPKDSERSHRSRKMTDPLHTIINQALADLAKAICVFGIVVCIMIIAVGFAP